MQLSYTTCIDMRRLFPSGSHEPKALRSFHSWNGCRARPFHKSDNILASMVNDSSHLSGDSPDESRQEIDDLVDEIARLSKSDCPAAEFHTGLLGRVVSGLAAVAGVVWVRQRAGNLRAEYQINLGDALPTENPDALARHQRLIEEVLLGGQPRLIHPQSGSPDAGKPANPTDFLLVLCPWEIDGEPAGVVEVFQRPGTRPKAQQGYLQFLAIVCELLTDFHWNDQLRDFKRQSAQWGRFEQFTQLVHGSLDSLATTYQIANEGRRLIGCDRVTVMIRRGSRCKVAAVSGVETFDRRSNITRLLEQLAATVVLVDEPLWYTDSSKSPLPQIERRLNAYLDESHARTLAVIPLTAAAAAQSTKRSDAIGVLVIERFEAGIDDDLRRRATAVCQHGALALRNALEVEQIPLVRLLRMAGWFIGPQRWPKTVAALAATIAVVFALATVPADFEIEAHGELQPLTRRDVFAPSNGVVSDLRVEHARQVHAEDVLAVLREPQLSMQFKRVWGELQTAKKRLDTVKAQRLQSLQRGREDRREDRRDDRWTAEEGEIEELIVGLQQQYEIVKSQQAELTVRSPITGQILTWGVRELLEARPVRRGDVLMTVADLDGTWVLELQIPDDRVAHVLTARKTIGRDLGVSFVSASNPGVSHHGVIRSVAARTEMLESDRPVVLATVEINRSEIPNLVPGTTVVARIHCGRRSIGYVWLRDLIEAVQTWLVF